MTDSYRKDPEAISQLSPRQYAVTQEAATEPAFDNEFWDKKEAGHLRRHRVGRAPVRLHQEVRQRLRLAQLHGAARAGQRRRERRTRATG